MTPNGRNASSLRVLVLAPSGADARVATELLAEHDIEARTCSGIPEMCEQLEQGGGALLLTEEALTWERPELLTEQLAAQDAWSDIPIIVLTSSGEDARWSEVLGSLFAASGNLTLIERPCSAATLTSAAQVALRARRKQYEARELLLSEQRALGAASAALEQARRSEAAREALLDSERAARADAERANRLKDEFLASLSHELRTPLSVIVSWGRVLERNFGAHNEQLRHGLSIITENALAQAQLICDLLDMSRIVSGKMSIDPHPTELTTLVAKAVSAHRPAAEAKSISIELRQPAEAPTVLADATRLTQVFWNLLSNAIKFTPEGGEVSIETVASPPDHLAVIIRDNGEGIPQDFLPHIFDRFRQADGSVSRRHGGLGIGLAIVRQLVELHGGEIEAHSEGPGRGASFTVRLPVRRIDGVASAADPLAVWGEEESVASDALAGLRVLAVEDQPQMLEIVRRTLEEHGAHVTAVGSGIEALEQLRAGGCSRFDILVSDIGMPQVDGYALIQTVRTQLALSETELPAVAVTAFARPEDRTRLTQAGFQAHLTKPYQVVQLVATVRRLARRGGVNGAHTARATLRPSPAA